MNDNHEQLAETGLDVLDAADIERIFEAFTLAMETSPFARSENAVKWQGVDRRRPGRPWRMIGGN